MAQIQRVRGMPDWLGSDAAQLRTIEQAAIEVARIYGYAEVRLPVIEPVELFVRSVGEETDIVGKEMYRFVDRGGEEVCLRPEGTAGAVRAYLEAGMHRAGVQRWFYLGPMFRRERPQKGRLRQFHQFGCECFGLASASADAELLALARRFLARLGLDQRCRLHLNSLGCRQCRPIYREKLVAFLQAHRAQLCADCQRRIERNPLRVLDCKNESCQAVLADAPATIDFLCNDCAAHFGSLRAALDAMGIEYQIDPRIVRGLDYYTRTAFEFVATGLGAQATVLAGGRYDDLVSDLGGPATPAVGFAAGIERLALLLEEEPSLRPDAAIVAVGDAMLEASLALAERLRNAGLCVVHAGGGSVKRQMKQADRLAARFAVIVGEEEWQQGTVMLREMQSGKQQPVSQEELVAHIRA